MLCLQCGAEITEPSQTFCHICGARIEQPFAQRQQDFGFGNSQPYAEPQYSQDPRIIPRPDNSPEPYQQQDYGYNAPPPQQGQYGQQFGQGQGQGQYNQYQYDYQYGQQGQPGQPGRGFFGGMGGMAGGQQPFGQQSYQQGMNQQFGGVNVYNTYNNYGAYPVGMDGFSHKNRWVALGLCCLGFMGCGGIHRLYSGKIGSGLLWLFTGGLFGIGTIVDLITIAIGNWRDNQGRFMR